MKRYKILFVIGIVFIFFSLIIYITKGNTYIITSDYEVINGKFLLHLFWALYFTIIGHTFVIIAIISHFNQK